MFIIILNHVEFGIFHFFKSITRIQFIESNIHERDLKTYFNVPQNRIPVFFHEFKSLYRQWLLVQNLK